MTELKICTIPESHQGRRLDQSLADLFAEFSRMRIQAWIKSGAVRVNEQRCKPSYIVEGGEQVEMQLETQVQTQIKPQSIKLDVVHDDQQVLVLNKPAGLVVHPGAGNMDGTLLNGLLHAYPQQKLLPRGGIVHRLDKDTSGIMVVAKTLLAHTSLVSQIQERKVGRRYLALVQGNVISGDTIDAPIGRHPRDRVRMAVVDNGKPAVTHFRVSRRYPYHTLLDVQLETGRTHQIRVHLANIGYPILGDSVYAGRKRSVAGLSDALNRALTGFPRQALHAYALEFDHPESHERVHFQIPLAADIDQLLDTLSQESAS